MYSAHTIAEFLRGSNIIFRDEETINEPTIALELWHPDAISILSSTGRSGIRWSIHIPDILLVFVLLQPGYS